MIREISITNIGSLVNFSNRASLFPTGHSIVHGMNGSGKSQLSLVFQKISKLRTLMQFNEQEKHRIKNEVMSFFISRKSKEALSENIEVKINAYTLQFNTVTQDLRQSGTIPNFYVFNEEYVKQNVGVKVELPEKKIRIGEKNKERDDLLAEIKEIEKTIKTLNESIKKLVEQTKIESGYSTQVRTNRLISIENYLKDTNIGEKNEEAQSKLDALTSPPDSITFHLSIQFPTLFTEKKEKEKIDKIFSKSYFEPKLTRKFYSLYIALNKQFYEKGVALFKENPTLCPFCLTAKDLGDPDISELIAYIDSEYNESLNTLNKYLLSISNFKKSLVDFITRWNNHINTINEKAQILSLTKTVIKLSFSLEDFNHYCDLLRKKTENMLLMQTDLGLENSIYTYFEQLLQQLRNDYQFQISFIEEINEEIESLSSKKRILGEQIIKHHMYILWNKSGLRDNLKQLSQELEDKNVRYEELNTSISNDRTIDFFNQILRILGINKYELNDESSLILKLDNEYDISQEGFRISSGERKFIALSYFFAEVLASVNNSTDLKNITIIIDDPVDSSDYNKFYSFVSVIENFSNILKVIYKNDTITLGQFIIFTHNALLFERFINSRSMHSFILQIKNGKTIIEKPQKKIGLITFSSYIKKITNYIKRMERSNNKNIGNYIRRILEIIASIENIDTNSIQNLNATSKLNALANHLSHGSLERLIDPLPESHEYVAACIELIEEIRRRIPALYKTIVDNYLNNIEIDEYRAKYERLFRLS